MLSKRGLASLFSMVFVCVLLFCPSSFGAGLVSNTAKRESPAIQISYEAFLLNYKQKGLSAIPEEEGKATLLIWLTPPPAHYIYAPYSQEYPAGLKTQTQTQNGLPTSIILTALPPDSDTSFPVNYPLGTTKKDSFSAQLTPVYESATPFFATIPVETLDQGLQMQVSGLLCSAVSCTPFKQQLDIKGLTPQTLNIESVESAPPWFKLRETATWREPHEAAEPSLPNASAEQLFDAITPTPFNLSLEVQNLWEAIIFGLFAGLILNLMPCVLPVISLKLTVFASIGNIGEDEAQRRAFRQYNIFFSLGILVWFGILLIVLGAAGMLWGQFFQSQSLVITLTLLLFVLALSMFGIYNLPVFDIRLGSSGSQARQAFFSGMLATLLATPCSGPLLGGVLGWATQQSTAYLAAAIMSVGLGMSTPFLLMALKPGLVNLLPRSGAWALTLERVIGFMVMGTVLYLLHMLPSAMWPEMLIAMLLLAVAMWFWGQVGGPVASDLKRGLSRGAAVLLTALAIWWVANPPTTEAIWEPYTEASFKRLLGNTPMMVEFTAEWCPNCKAMEYAVLIPRRLKRWKENYGLRYIRVDLTQDNPEGQALLQKLHSSSIPALAIFPAGSDAANPTLLRDLVTPPQLKQAIESALENP